MRTLLPFVAAASALNLQVTSNKQASLSEPLLAYADLKIGKPLERYADLLNSNAELHLKVESRSRHDAEHQGVQAHIAEVTAYCKDKSVIHCASSSENMYASLDELTDTLARKLRKYKERARDTRQDRRRESKTGLADALLEDDDDDDVLVQPAPSPTAVANGAAASANGAASGSKLADPIALVRRKEFPMPPITVADAIVCLDYIDHDFYVFRNAESKEINVVYRRNSGGVGLIEPEQDLA